MFLGIWLVFEIYYNMIKIDFKKNLYFLNFNWFNDIVDINVIY